jgi:hypothetical protein
VSGDVAVYEGADEIDDLRPPWPLKRLRTAGAPEDCLLFSDPLLPDRALAAERMRPADKCWEVDSSLPFTAKHSGAVLVSRGDGSIVGVLIVSEKGKARVALLPAGFAGPSRQK